MCSDLSGLSLAGLQGDTPLHYTSHQYGNTKVAKDLVADLLIKEKAGINFENNKVLPACGGW